MVQTAQLILGDLQYEADQATWHIIIPIITITSETSHGLKRDSEGTTGRDKSAPIPASKIFSLLDREPTFVSCPVDAASLWKPNFPQTNLFYRTFYNLEVFAAEKKNDRGYNTFIYLW